MEFNTTVLGFWILIIAFTRSVDVINALRCKGQWCAVLYYYFIKFPGSGWGWGKRTPQMKVNGYVPHFSFLAPLKRPHSLSKSHPESLSIETSGGTTLSFFRGEPFSGLSLLEKLTLSLNVIPAEIFRLSQQYEIENINKLRSKPQKF